MHALGLGLGLQFLRAATTAAEGNIVNGSLVLFNADDSTWYAFPVELIGSDPIFGAGAATTEPEDANPTVTLPCPQDDTTHVVGCMNDEGGAPVMYTEQDDAGVPGEDLSISDFDLIVFQDEGGAYTAIPS